MEDLEDGFYQARKGELRRIEPEDDDLRKIRVTPEVFEAVRDVQKRMRKLLNGHKPDVNLVAEALLLYASKAENIEDAVKRHAASVFADTGKGQKSP